ncbi:type IV toxin-antitoxin system AbiEi family antitoxin [candidate division CSSED10-310 bacterium]|uniref:Type IV toxin-antitoxin system AbiEi family antitoxin n=1 Tax=candidate division CSSED10-310 bacterium TaxID=2855610 RepID=A0ABV6Z1D1_UNCC1
MSRITGKDTLQKVAQSLAEWFKTAEHEIPVSDVQSDRGIDGYIHVAGLVFGVQIKNSSNYAQIMSALHVFKNMNSLSEKSFIPLLVVPYMGELGRKLCQKEAVSWIDLSGNADIFHQNIRILIDGRPNLFTAPGRPPNPFAPKSSRITRWLLMNTDQAISQRELAQQTEMDEGFTSRIVTQLEKQGLIARLRDRTIVVPDPDSLLDAWRESYDFDQNHILKGHIAERSSNERLMKLSHMFQDHEIQHAATGLCAAWQYTQFAGFRIVTFYIDSHPSADLLSELKFREDVRGSNTWLVVPKDEGVFQGSSLVVDIQCVHPVQTYLDLFGHPERSKDAAEYIRSQLLNWNKNA